MVESKDKESSAAAVEALVACFIKNDFSSPGLYAYLGPVPDPSKKLIDAAVGPTKPVITHTLSHTYSLSLSNSFTRSLSLPLSLSLSFSFFSLTLASFNHSTPRLFVG